MKKGHNYGFCRICGENPGEYPKPMLGKKQPFLSLYNMKRIGSHRSEKTKQKISLSHIGLTPTNETRKKLSNAKKGLKLRLGAKLTDLTKNKIRIAHLHLTIQRSLKMRRIWFKKDCVKWMLDGKKTTTFRSRKHVGEYEIDFGSRYKPKPSGIVLKLIPLVYATSECCINFDYKTEGCFSSIGEFRVWLDRNKLSLPDVGWLHSIEVLKK